MKINVNKIYLSVIFILLIVLIFQRVSLINTVDKYETNIESLSQNNEILVSSKNSEKNWLVALNSNAVASALGQIIELITSTNDTTLLRSKGSALLQALRRSNAEDTQLFRDELDRKSIDLREIESPSQ